MPDRMYTTREMMSLVGIKSRTTIYSRGWQADEQLPGPSGAMLWSRRTIQKIAKELGVKVEWP